MPPRQNRLRTRSPDRQRSWGTRFDTLVSPPPQERLPVPPSPANDIDAPPPLGDAAGAKTGAHTPILDLFGASARPSERRDWADDDVPLILSPHSRTSTAGGTPKPERLPHNASVFVGSLPPDANEGEVAQPLREHLSAYASIREVKIIRDSKGGLCAFVQCENPGQAVQLVSQAQINPRPFMGRTLRFESAKARRSLWVSYKTPKHFVPCAADDNALDVTVDGTGVKGRWVETSLPDALRIWKPLQARFPVVSYCEEARNPHDHSSQGSFTASDRGQAFTSEGIFFPKLKFDAQSIELIAAAFGPLEHFKIASSAATAEKGMETIPLEHRGKRSIEMDSDIWEVKWEHRDDSISAFNTMKTIPHLAVSWARESSTTGPRGELGRSPAYHSNLIIPSPFASTSPSFSGRRPLLLMDSKKFDDGAKGNSSSSFGESAPGPFKRHDGFDDGWTLVRSQSHGTFSAALPPVRDGGDVSPALTDKLQRSPEWKDGDFPPLDSSLKRLGLRNDAFDGATPTDFHRKTVDEPDTHTPSTASASKPVGKADDECASPVAETKATVTRPRAIHRRSLSNPIGRHSLPEITKHATTHRTPDSQTLDLPPTPDLANNSIADTPTSMHFEPPTPVNTDLTISEALVPEQKEVDVPATPVEANAIKIERDHFRRPTLDRKAIFVGGLETTGQDAWDEGRLYAVFGKYGQIVEVRMMQPTAKKTAFAFITFADEEGPIKSIRYEHNRTYYHRPIRVQMRDINASRGGGGFRARGRGQGRRSNFEPRMFSDFQQRQQMHGSFSASSNSASHDGNTGPDPPFGSAHFHPANLALAHNSAPYAHPSQSNSTSSSEPSSVFSNNATTRHSGFFQREADSRTSISLTPPPSQNSAALSNAADATAGPLTPVSAQPSHQPTGFSAPHGWPAAYATPYGYPMPYGVLPHGMMPMVPMHANSQSSEVAPSPTTTMPAWSPISPFPYVPYQYFVMPTPQASSQQGPVVPSSAPSQASSPGKNQPQPPLVPGQVIQGEHGAFIPVYHPQALSDYMGNSSPVYSMPEQRLTSSTSSSGQSQAMHTYGAPHAWAGGPPPVLAVQIPTQQVTASQPLTPSHVQPSSQSMAARGGMPASTSSSSATFQEHQRSVPQLMTSQVLPLHGYPVPTHNSMSAMPSSGHSSLPKISTSFSHQSLDTDRSHASHDHQRRRDSFSFGKPKSNSGHLGRSPSAVRIGHRGPSGTMSTSHSAGEHTMGGFALQQSASLPQISQPQSQGQARPPLPNVPIGFATFNTDTYPQLHRMANHPQQFQQ